MRLELTSTAWKAVLVPDEPAILETDSVWLRRLNIALGQTRETDQAKLYAAETRRGLHVSAAVDVNRIGRRNKPVYVSMSGGQFALD